MKSIFRFTLVCCATLSLMSDSVYSQFRLDIRSIADQVNESVIDSDPGSEDQVKQQLLGIRRPVVIRNFDQLIFNQHSTSEKAKSHLLRELRTWIDKADARLELTANERAKLWLAGASDIASYFQDAQELSRVFAKGNAGDELNGAVIRLKHVQKRMRDGVCSKGSMLSKVSKRVFDHERNAKAASHNIARRKFAHKSSAKLVIAEIDKTMPLTAKQRETLLGVMLKHEPEKMVDHRTFYAHALTRLRGQAVVDLLELKDTQRWRAALMNAKSPSQMGSGNIFQLELKR